MRRPLDRVNTPRRSMHSPASARGAPPCCPRQQQQAGTTDDDNLLHKAQSIERFLQRQRGRVRAAAGKAAWLQLARNLGVDRLAAEQQLTNVLEQPPPDCCPSLATTLRQHAQQLAADASAAASARKATLEQARALARAVASLRCPPPGCTPDRVAQARAKVQAAFRAFTAGLREEAARLSEEEGELSIELEKTGADSAKAASLTDGGCSSLIETRPLEESTVCDDEGGAGGAANGVDAIGASSQDCGVSDCVRTEDGALESDRSAAELEALIRSHPLAPPDSAEGLRVAWRCMVAAHKARLQEVRAAADELVASGKHGGWTADDHALFVESCKRARGEAAACGPTAALEKLALLLPHKTLAELRQHDAWYANWCSLRHRQRAALAALGRQRQAFLSDAARLLSEVEALELEAANAAIDALEWGAAGDRKRTVVAALQAKQGERRREEAAHAAAEAARAAAKHAEVAKREAVQREQERMAVKQHQDSRTAAAAAEKEERQRAAAAAARASAAAVASERPAVAARQAAALSRFVELQESRARQEAAALEAAARLDASVPHPDAPADPARLLQRTECGAVAPEPQGRAFAPVYGYSSAQVAADPRFRVLEALGAAGLRGTRSAAEAVAGMAPLRAVRVDALTTVERASRF